MSLEWNFSNCADMDLVGGFIEGREEEGIITQSLAFFSMIAGVGWSITEENADEWWCRVAFYEALNGPLRYRPTADGTGVEYVPMTREDIQARIGFWSNGTSKKETRRQWTARISEQFMKDKVR